MVFSERIVILGNQNNNAFAIMRYLRQMGFDAHLLMFSNDGIGPSGHFAPQEDTWEWGKWKNHVSVSRIPDYLISAVPVFWGWLYWFAISIAHLLGVSDGPWKPVSKRTILEDLAPFDIVIGSGVAPAVLRRAGRRIDLFFNYSTGIEFVKGVPFNGISSWYGTIFKILSFPIRNAQKAGLRSARVLVIPPEPPSEEVVQSLGLEYQRTFIPMVFAPEEFPEILPDGVAGFMSDVRSWKQSSHLDFLCFSAARQYWSVKQSDMFLQAYAELVAESKSPRIGLALVEYGPDVQRSKQLISKLGLSELVHWLPIMARKEIRIVSGLFDLSIGEFMRGPNIWGGTAWEALADGRPLLQGFHWTPDEFELIAGVPAPPFLRARDKSDVVEKMRWAALNRTELYQLGKEGQQWFERYQGMALARQWVDLIERARKPRSDQMGP